MAIKITPKIVQQTAKPEAGRIIVPAGSAIQSANAREVVQYASVERFPGFDPQGLTANFDVTTAPFPTAIKRTALSIMFENREYIADAVMPRVKSGQRFSWRRYRAGETYRRQDVRIGRTSRPNEVEFGYDEIEARTEDFGLEVPIPQDDIDNAKDAGVGYDPINTAIRKATNYVQLEREVRVANLLTDTTNYFRSDVLTGSAQFSDYTYTSSTNLYTSNPISVISEALRRMVARANTMVMSEDVYDVLSRHPQMVRAFNGNDGGSGIVPQDFMKQLFRVQNIYIGSSWVDNNSADLPTTPLLNTTLSRLWGKGISLLRIDPTANLSEGITWGMTAQWKERVTNVRYDAEIGLEGGQRVRVGEHVKEVINAKEFGHFIAGAIA